MKNPILIAVIAALVVGAGAFFGGMKYQETKAATNNRNRIEGQRFGQRSSGNFQPVRGEITSADNGSITVKMQDGSSKIVLVSDTTAITEAKSAPKESLTNGTKVMVFGSNNSDGSVTAQNIQLNPTEGFGGDNSAAHQGGNADETPR